MPSKAPADYLPKSLLIFLYIFQTFSSHCFHQLLPFI
uniref:Uncharacterized protein n=1 Tax=Ciona intestinalis TaxID=7719 RepID=H2XVL5_CIOIN